MQILWINPFGNDASDVEILSLLNKIKHPDTQVDVVSLPTDRPHHVEYHAYEALVLADIVQLTYQASEKYDAVVIGCFYDGGLREAREVSGKMIVTAPCEAATSIACALGNTFSVLVGRRKWMPKMSENVHLYGHGRRMASMRPLGLGMRDFQQDHDRTCDRLMTEGRKAIEEDGAEVLILGCTAETGFQAKMQQDLGVPVIDAVQAPFKQAEFLVELAQRFGWYPSRKGGSEPPPQDELIEWALFSEPAPVRRNGKQR
jgi:allantoin racemase